MRQSEMGLKRDRLKVILGVEILFKVDPMRLYKSHLCIFLLRSIQLVIKPSRRADRPDEPI